MPNATGKRHPVGRAAGRDYYESVMPKILRNAPIRDWEAGDSVQGFALLTKKEQRQDRNGKSFLDMELADASGSIVTKVWADSPALNGAYETHQFVAFRGSVKSYRDQLQLSIDACRVANEQDRGDGFNESLLVPSTKEDIGDLWRRLERLMDGVGRPVLRRLARETLDAYGQELREHPAAKSMHHAYRGGLLEAVEHALIFQPFGATGALENFAHDDQGAQAAFGLVVGRRHVWVAQEGEHVFLFGSEQPLTNRSAVNCAARRSVA